jgi:hypothetical protein
MPSRAPDRNALTIDFVRERLAAIRSTLLAGDFADIRFGPIAFLQSEIGKHGSLRNIDAELRVLDDGVMDFETGRSGMLLLLSERFLAAASKLVEERKLTARQKIWMIDNFLIHELLHSAQGMSGGRHSDLRLHSPQTLLSIDYQADAAAVLVAVVLAWSDPKAFGYESEDAQTDLWTLYREGVRAVTHQIDIFTYIGRRDLNQAAEGKTAVTIERLQRIAAWHFQHHRAENFNTTLSVADFQILHQPGIDFRNTGAAGMLKPDLLNIDWPQLEPEFVEWLGSEKNRKKLGISMSDRVPLILTSSSPTGTTRFVRFAPASQRHYRDAFVGFFSANLSKSYRFFTSLLQDCEWATGGPKRRDRAGRKILPSTSGLALDQSRKMRQVLLAKSMRPENHAIVFARRSAD